MIEENNENTQLQSESLFTLSWWNNKKKPDLVETKEADYSLYIKLGDL